MNKDKENLNELSIDDLIENFNKLSKNKDEREPEIEVWTTQIDELF